MPVTFKVASHPAEPYPTQQIYTSSAEAVLQKACSDQWMQCSELLQSSITPNELSTLVPQGNGFVQAVLAAYKQHHNLVIRPDDVWMAILSQLSFYVNAHAEELREYFVAHQGKKKLTVQALGNRYTVDFGSMARQMTSKIHEEVVDKTLVEWILPDFTTTNVKDTTICAVLMMSSLKSYFDYRMVCICGIPSVTLQGERADWQSLLDRLDRLPELGPEPAVWARMLRPILARFLRAFDLAPADSDSDSTTSVPLPVPVSADPDLAQFWSDVAHSHPVFYGPGDMSGWITAFSVWSAEGKWQAGPLAEITSPRPLDEYDEKQREYIEKRRYTLDGVTYPNMGVSQIAQGFCEVDVLLDDNGAQFECMMVAGHVAFAVSSLSASTSSSPSTVPPVEEDAVDTPRPGPPRRRGPAGATESARKGGGYDTLSPAPQWFMFVKGQRVSAMEAPPVPSYQTYTRRRSGRGGTR